MHYYEVLPADGYYRNDDPLVYSSEQKIAMGCLVSVPLRQRFISGIVGRAVSKPSFVAKPIKTLVSEVPLPPHAIELARWLSQYYATSLGVALRLFAPSQTTLRRKGPAPADVPIEQLSWKSPLTPEQKRAIGQIESSPSTTVLLHGTTGSGKTRVYLELAAKALGAGRSAILLTPEISLTAQLLAAAKANLSAPIFMLHSGLSSAERKKIWLQILETTEPVVVMGARSALFAPVHKLGLIVLDEAHEPAYKSDSAPRYHASRVASQLGMLTSAKVILGSATPLVSDYYLAESRNGVVKMDKPAIASALPPKPVIIDLKNRSNFSLNPYLSNQLIDAIKSTLSAKKQIIIYFNRRGSARLILCSKCGWQMLCPNCDIPLVYHGDEHLAVCHTCGYKQAPPNNCPVCANPQLIYRGIGTKALAEEVRRLFPQAVIQRFDGDNKAGEGLHEQFADVASGKIDILVGTQLLAKGLDLPHLGLVGIINAETSLSLPDFSAEERSYQLISQVIGRAGRGHGQSQVIIQTYEPDSLIIQAAAKRDWGSFYARILGERQQFRFPPYAYLLQLVVKRASATSAQKAATDLKQKLKHLGLPVEIIGPAPSFYARRGQFFYYQLVVKAKNRSDLVKLTSAVPADWQVNLDPLDLL